ncbi:hypothetical protein RTG_03150 [Rhodotorula toruloides ATCC 204091]|uniref:Uncharacterized protein n=1 Tax=Rhodotorula toruloides TaxID=5286 RepID=A0A0K3CP76_RHOTO|nr:hypothetical protein RTG_03150 [Rhodotorula toruloides ATCC 204091]
MMWAAATWFDAARGKDKIRELVRVQKTAAMSVTGGFRSAAGKALEVEAARRRSPHASHRSPLDFALTNPLIPPDLVVETIHLDPVSPWSPNPAPHVELAHGKEIGTHEHKMVVHDLPTGLLLVYTDGSMGESGIVGAGAAARLWDEGRVVLKEGEEVNVGLWQRERKEMGQRQTTADSPLTALISLDNTSALAHLTPTSHFGGCRRRSAEDAVVCVVDEIKGRWRKGNAVVGLALDVSKAFPSVQTEQLTANLKSRGLPNSACAWIRSFLSDRLCTLQLEGVVSETIK